MCCYKESVSLRSIPAFAAALAAPFTLTMFAALVAACGSSTSTDGSKFPAQPEGCTVQVFHEAPNVRTSNIGRVSTTCDAILSDEECLRGLMDEACKLGADVVWGVADKPTLKGSKKTLSGRAAHTSTETPR